MNIEQIAVGIKDSHGLDMSDEAAITLLRHALSKLAEQDAEPVAWMDKYGVLWDGVVDGSALKYQPLYTETQLIAAQQRTAEACAKVAANGVGTGAYNDCCPNTDWEEGQDAIASAIRNGDWSEYL